jgi:hypothetical protein
MYRDTVNYNYHLKLIGILCIMVSIAKLAWWISDCRGLIRAIEGDRGFDFP